MATDHASVAQALGAIARVRRGYRVVAAWLWAAAGWFAVGLALLACDAAVTLPLAALIALLTAWLCVLPALAALLWPRRIERSREALVDAHRLEAEHRLGDTPLTGALTIAECRTDPFAVALAQRTGERGRLVLLSLDTSSLRHAELPRRAGAYLWLVVVIAAVTATLQPRLFTAALSRIEMMWPVHVTADSRPSHAKGPTATDQSTPATPSGEGREAAGEPRGGAANTGMPTQRAATLMAQAGTLRDRAEGIIAGVNSLEELQQLREAASRLAQQLYDLAPQLDTRQRHMCESLAAALDDFASGRSPGIARVPVPTGPGDTLTGDGVAARSGPDALPNPDVNAAGAYDEARHTGARRDAVDAAASRAPVAYRQIVRLYFDRLADDEARKE